ncbi:MAG: carboxypeptidase-like regulatory domain-containing protein, partial [Terriglobales bacterium]
MRLRLIVRQSGFSAGPVAGCLLALMAVFGLARVQVQAQSAAAAGLQGASVQGSVRDAKARPVAGATVYLQEKDGSGILSVHSDAAGSYRFSGLGEGIYTLRVEAAGYNRATFGPCVIEAKELKQLDLTLEAGGAPEFFDEPQFTVAGVTDGTNLGGHGSNAVVRTKESLA